MNQNVNFSPLSTTNTNYSTQIKVIIIKKIGQGQMSQETYGYFLFIVLIEWP